MVSQRSNGRDSAGSSHCRPRSGILDFPILKGMALTGIWNYEPNRDGPVITAEQGTLDISRRPQRKANNQNTKLCLQHEFSALDGTIISFKVRYDSVQPPTEVKLALAGGVTLRYDGRVLTYCCWDPNTEWFHHLGPSSIKVGDGKCCRVVLYICPDAIHIFENGDRVGVWRTRVSSPFRPTFNWQILAAQSGLQASLSDILIMTTAFPLPGASSPWEISFSGAPCPPGDDVWLVRRQDYDPFRVDFVPEGYVRIATRRLLVQNGWVFTQAASPLLSDDGILMYRLRINAAGGSETKITLFAGLTLHIRKQGQHLKWGLHIDQRRVSSEAEADNESAIRVGCGEWTVVTILYSPSSVTLFEDDVAKFSSRRRDFTSPRAPLFHVQHLDVGTAVEVDLSHVRSVPGLKMSEALVRDLKPHLVAYYPLSQVESESDSISSSYSHSYSHPSSMRSLSPSLDLATTQPGYEATFPPPRTLLPFHFDARGPEEASEASAVSALLDLNMRSSTPTSTSSSALSSIFTFPSPPTATSNHLSYTIALWLRVEQYPGSEEEPVSIAGPLSLRPDGRIAFSFAATQAPMSSAASSSPPIISTTSIPLSQWLSVIATYVSEQSSYVFFIDGEMDSVFYASPAPPSAPEELSPRATQPMAGSISVTPSPHDDTCGMNALHVQIQHLMIFDVFFHEPVARALANLHRSSRALGSQNWEHLSDMFPITSH